MADCFHCSLPIPANDPYRLEIDGEEQSFCCTGCLAIASAIVEGGLENFYQFRSEMGVRPDANRQEFQAYDLPDVQQEFVDTLENTGEKQAALLLEGITCAACVWLIEHHLSALEGITSVRVNATTHRCLVTWNPEHLQLSAIMQSLDDIGYQPHPASNEKQQVLRETENRRALMRLGVAGFGMMQVGMVAVGLYSGADEDWVGYLRWLSLIIATPVVFFAAQPFFSAALRSLKSRHLTMDVSVSLAIGGAYLASCWATLTHGGEVYFDSVSMFTFFLLWGRYLEMRVRHRNGIDTDKLAQVLPVTATRKGADGEFESVPIKQLQVGDWILVPSGTHLPCDGTVLEGCSGVVETLITGEPDAVAKQPGDQVIAGTLNTDSPLHIEVSAVGRQTKLSAIESLVEQAQQEKPSQVALADRLAGYFVGFVLVVAASVATAWWYVDSSKALWVTLSVLVVTCPCALSLASPTALTVAVAWLRQQGLLVTKGHVMEGLNQIDRVIFDKTGTLTVGRPQLVQVLTVAAGGSLEEDHEDRKNQLLAWCAALEQGSTHPIARAFEPYATHIAADNIRQTTGEGVEGEIDGQPIKLGKPQFVGVDQQPPTGGQWLALGSNGQLLAWIRLQDQLRDTAVPMVEALRKRGLQLELLSGDGEASVELVASQLGISQWKADQSPADKLSHLKAIQNQGGKVLMVGDGINDVPVLSSAFVSVAMGGATDLAQTQADGVLLNSNLMTLDAGFDCAARTRQIIRQNLGWALCYNVSALPLAALALIPPWAAAIGMSASSLIVLLNALRINRLGTAADR